ncbi:hypothetical protein [Martelella soudanensis]|uniref:hypothetical protein n=1 Tax=unclassified Martelella TaxID=2629616 RepID=UPI0015DE9251|nr:MULTISPECIES: hypothetical protein [unclassified Martelella]
MFDKIESMVIALASAAVGAAVIIILGVLIFIPKAHHQGLLDERAAVARKALEAWQDRTKDDAKLQAMSPYDLCVSYVGRAPECDELRALPQK